MNSCTVLAGTLGLTTSTCGIDAATVTIWKLFFGSNGSLGSSVAAIAYDISVVSMV